MALADLAVGLNPGHDPEPGGLTPGIGLGVGFQQHPTHEEVKKKGNRRKKGAYIEPTLPTRKVRDFLPSAFSLLLMNLSEGTLERVMSQGRYEAQHRACQFFPMRG